MNLYDLKPGRYVLTAPVQNPRPDRRVKPPRGDWRCYATIPAGWHFIVPKGRADAYAEIRPEGGYSHECLYIMDAREDHAGSLLLAALLPHLAPATHTLYSMLDFEGWASWHSPLLDQLVSAGKITIDDVRDAVLREIDKPE